MKDIKWFIDRLKTMNLQELMWRVKQKRLQNKEDRDIYFLGKSVTDIPLPNDIAGLHIDVDKININWTNRKWSKFRKLDLFGIFDYDIYKNKWNAGFQTENCWPEELFSPTINISQRVDIGDIRTNWELNRHYQFSALAKTYYCTRDNKYLIELVNLFNDWNAHNLFLHGVEWLSVMEIAIRVNSWVYMFCFLKQAECNDEILGRIEHGILVMADYILKHRARFSSANNHLIIEMYAVALVGIITNYYPWENEALKVLTEELQKQNYSDGINKEMSLHYQSFVMEAYALLWLLMGNSHIEIPVVWKEYLSVMAKFLADSIDKFGTSIEFGDNDEGKILDLGGILTNYYQYILGLMGYILDNKYTDTDENENLNWIVPEELKKERRRYEPKLVSCRKEGGYTFIRSKDRRILIGIDHASLGFGKIAAHGHADALSFQITVDGHPLITDPGTYIYHCGLELRNDFRSTKNHNTITVYGKNQSEILGPFLWGKRAECRLLELEESSEEIVLMAEHNGYKPITHKRKFIFDKNRILQIKDMLSDQCDYMVTIMLAPGVGAVVKGNKVHISTDYCICEIQFEGNDVFKVSVRDALFSRKYGIQENTHAISVKAQGKGITTKITVWETP